MTLLAKPSSASPSSAAQRIEELGAMVKQYSDLTVELERSHQKLQKTVQSLRNELSEKNKQLERRKRLAALGEMAAGMAHEIRNPLGGIQLYASMLARDVKEHPDQLALVEKIAGGVRRLEGLVSQVLQYTRELQARLAEADVAELVDQAVEWTHGRVDPDQVRFTLRGPRPLRVTVDPLLTGQAILNLLINSVEAMEGRGEIDIEWAAGTAGGSGQFRLMVRDNGPGIAAEAMDRIFNPFFTTKETGTGLGLAMVHRIVEAHEGTITAGNVQGGGAVFEMNL